MRQVLPFRAGDKADTENIKNGLKTIETRAGTVRYKDVKAGDTLVISCAGEKFEKTVKKVKHYDSIEALLTENDFKLIAPTAETVGDVYKMYASYPGYKDKIAKYGIMAFYL